MIKSYETQKPTAPTRKRVAVSLFKGLNTAVDEEVLPFSYSPKTYNYSFGKGTLDVGYGVQAAYINVNGSRWQIKKRGITVKFLKFFHYTMHHLASRAEKLVGYADDGKLYAMTISSLYSSFSEVSGSYGEVLDAVPYVYNDEDGLLVSTANGLYFLHETTITRLSFSQIFSTMCVHNDRVFAVLKLDEYKLYFSDDFDPKNWQISLQEGGYFAFDTEMGKVVKVISHGGYVFLFFEHGIMRLTAYNQQTEFRLQKLYLSPGTIYPGTVAVCGDKMIFASSDGVFSFDGVQIKKVMSEAEDLFDSEQAHAFAVHHGGKYYLACRLKMDSEIAGANNSLVVYDVWKDSFDVAHDINVLSMVALETDAVRGVLTEVDYPVNYIGLIGKVGAVDSTPTNKLWQSPVTSFGVSNGKKLLREFRLRTEGGGVLKVWLDGALLSFAFADGLSVIKVMRPFDKLHLAITSSSASSRVVLAEMTVDLYGE